MHVPSKPGGQSRRSPRRALALAFLWWVAQAAGAVEFDEKVQAPRVKNATDLRERGQSFATRFSQSQAAAPDAPVTNAALFKERFDLTWQIQRSIDDRAPPGDLGALGLVAQDQGIYRLDFAAAPQWYRLDRVLAAMLPQANWERMGPELIARGFRLEDVTTLRAYVDSHDAFAVARAQTLPVSLGFARAVRKFDKLKIPVKDEFVDSYLYQRSRVHDEALRAWARDLFATLDAQRRRILVSYYLENAGYALWTPDDRAAGIADVLASVRRPDFDKLATDEAQGVTP